MHYISVLDPNRAILYDSIPIEVSGEYGNPAWVEITNTSLNIYDGELSREEISTAEPSQVLDFAIENLTGFRITSNGLSQFQETTLNVGDIYKTGDYTEETFFFEALPEAAHETFVTDLTNTAWYFRETLSHFGIGEEGLMAGAHIGEYVAEFNINFYAGNHYPYTNLSYALGGGMTNSVYYSPNYDPTNDFIPYEAGWSPNDVCRTIWITGGDDITNPDLISWITKNATQVENPVIITDLTNTSWRFNDELYTWFVGEVEDDVRRKDFCNITFVANGESFNNLGYYGYGHWFYDGAPMVLSYNDTEVYNTGNWDEAYRIITITDGEDATNPEFIVWLTQNATQVTLEDSDDNGNTEPEGGYYLAFTSPKEFTFEAISDNNDGWGMWGDDFGSFGTPQTRNLGYWNGIIEYSTNGVDWSVWDDTTSISSSGGKLYLRGSGNTQITTRENAGGCSYYFRITGEQVSCTGNIETLLDYESVARGEHPKLSTYEDEIVYDCVGKMFYNCTALISPPDILMETIPAVGCADMFEGCTNLVKAPRITATKVQGNSFDCMFKGCTSLTQLPEIVATNLSIDECIYMFEGCSNIKISTEKTDEYKYEYRIPSIGDVDLSEWDGNATFATQGMFNETGGTFTGTPEVNKVYYTSNEIVRAFPPVEEEKPSATFDLTTLALPVGTYTIYVKLSAPGYRDSEASNEVVYSTEVALDPEFNHYGVIPEGWCLEYTDAEGEFYSLGEGDPFPVDKSIYANHASYYSSDEQYICEENEWRYEEILTAGDGGDVISVLASIDGLPVTSANLSSGNIGMYAIAAIIPVSVTTIVSVAPFWGNGRLTSITYLGTMEQWNQITLEPKWNKGCSEITVTCTDGTIIIPAYNS